MGCMKHCFYDDEDPNDPRNARKRSKGSPAMSQQYDSRPQSFMSGDYPPSRAGSFDSRGEPIGHGGGQHMDQGMGANGMPGGMSINIGNGAGGQPAGQMVPFNQMQGMMPGMMGQPMQPMMPYGMPYGMPYQMPPQQQQAPRIIAQNGNFALV